MPSAEIASPQAVADLLLLDELARLHKLNTMFLVLLPFAGLSLLVFDGDATATKVFLALLVAGFAATAAQYRMSVQPARFHLATSAAMVVVQMLAVLGATWYFGVFSPAALVAVFATFVLSHGNFTLLGATAWAVSGLGRLALVAALMTHHVADAGIIDGDGLSPIQMLALELLVQAVLGIAFATGRIANRSTTTKVTWLLDMVRRAARRELDIASKIQTTILPRQTAAAGYELAASMQPASEVGGDYYDLRPTPDGCWIGIGDVSGHGLTAGLIMLMVQTSVAALTADGALALTDIVERVNRVLHDNVRLRLRTDDFVTFSLLRLEATGHVAAAGRHEPILVHRAATGTVDVYDPEGMWLGIRPSLGATVSAVSFTLATGDTLILHTDGVTEAASATRTRYGIDRLVAAVKRHAALPAPGMREALAREVTDFMSVQTDDITLVVARYVGPGPRAAAV